MRLMFTLREFEGVVDDNYDALAEYEPLWIQLPDDEGWGLSVDGYRVVIPDIHISFRSGELYAAPKNPDDDWDFVSSVTIYYDENEEDAENVLAYSYGATEPLIVEACKKYNYPIEKLDDIECYIDLIDVI